MANIKKMDTEKSAVVASKGALNNPNLAALVDQIQKGFKPNRTGRSNRQIRIDNTAMIPNKKPIWAWRTWKDRDGNTIREEPQLIFRAGWYLSPTESYLVEELMKDKRNVELNEAIWAKMEEQGVQVEKEPAISEGEKVIA